VNPVIETILNRRSIRAYEDRPIADAVRQEILRAAMRAPTAGNMMLYSIIHVADKGAKETLARTCDNQPFIARAPLVLLFLADWERWYDYFMACGVEQWCLERGLQLEKPSEGDLMLACCDALIAAQTAVIAAESMGIGSCYIGDIMESYEIHRDLFKLPPYVFPICLLCFGYPAKRQLERPLSTRFGQEFIVFENEYRRLGSHEYDEMFRSEHERFAQGMQAPEGVRNYGQMMYLRKFAADFSKEMRRSVRQMLRAWQEA